MHFSFKPPWWSVCLLALSLAIFVRLGVWQWHRAAEKAQLITQQDKASQQFSSLTSSLKVKQYQGLNVAGTFDDLHVLLLDNRFYQHRAGFDVIELFKTAPNKYLLVDRGWVPASQNRKQLPIITNTQSNPLIKGSAYYPSSKSWVLNSTLDNKGQWPLIIEKINISELETLFGVRLYPFILRLDKKDPSALVRDWQVVTMQPNQHKGYAFQWFGFALAALIIFLVLNLERRTDGSK